MKHALGLLSRFILLLIVLILVLGSLVVLTRYVIGYDPQRARPDGLIVQMLVAFRDVAVVSLLIGAALSIFMIIRHTDRPFLPLILLAVVWTGLLVVGARVVPVPTREDARPDAVLPHGRVVRIGDTLIYTPADTDGAGMQPYLLISDEGASPRMQLIDGREVRGGADTLTIAGSSLDLNQMEISYPGMVHVPERLAHMMRDVRALTDLVLGNGISGPGVDPDLLLAIALGVFLLSCWTPARLTRWPLFNAVMVFLSVRGAVWLVYSIHYGELGSLITTLVNPEQIGLVTAGALGFVALVFAVIALLLSPLSSWKREVGDE